MQTKPNPIIIFFTLLTLASLSCSLVTRTLNPGTEATPTTISAAATPISPTQVEKFPTEKAPEEKPASTKAPEKPQGSPSKLGEVYREAVGGYAFQQIPGWSIEGGFGIISMIAPDVDPEKGPSFAMIGTLEDTDTTLDARFDEYTADAGSDSDVTLSEPVDIQVGGVAARRVELTGTDDAGDEVAGSLVIAMVTPRQSFVLMGYAPAGLWEDEILPLFNAVLATVEFFEPEASPLEPTPEEPLAKSDQLIRQWATAAEATSEYGSSDWSAQQATGAPDTFNCGDSTTAWASAESDSVDSITLYFYDAPLIPTEINIVQSYNPSQVVKVEVIDPAGGSETIVYEAEPEATDECPYTLSIPVADIDYLVMGVRITVDQSVLGLGWNEIDAVELVGYPEAGYEPQPTTPPVSGGNIWENVQVLPIFPSAENVTYQDENILSYTVSDSTRQDVLNYILAELEGIGWLTDVDEDGNCRNVATCLSKLAELDYDSPDNVLWYFIHVESPDTTLTLTLVESSGMVVVAMALQ